ncbi:hypothetical protein VPH35_007988 [Triticum aestivum]
MLLMDSMRKTISHLFKLDGVVHLHLAIQLLSLFALTLLQLYSRIRIQSCDATPFAPSSKVAHELIQTFRVHRTPSRVNQPEGISDPKERGPGSDLSLLCAVG